MIMFKPLSAENTRSTARRSASSKSKLIGCPVYCFCPVPGTSELKVCGALGCAVGSVGGGGGAVCCGALAAALCVALCVARETALPTVSFFTGGATRGSADLPALAAGGFSALVGSARAGAGPLG